MVPTSPDNRGSTVSRDAGLTKPMFDLLLTEYVVGCHEVSRLL